MAMNQNKNRRDCMKPSMCKIANILLSNCHDMLISAGYAGTFQHDFFVEVIKCAISNSRVNCYNLGLQAADVTWPKIGLNVANVSDSKHWTLQIAISCMLSQVDQFWGKWRPKWSDYCFAPVLRISLKTLGQCDWSGRNPTISTHEKPTA